MRLLLLLSRRVLFEWFSFFCVGMPARIRPLAVAQNENLAHAPRGYGSLPVLFGLIQVLAIENGDIAEALNFGLRKLQADQLSSRGLEPGCGLKDIRLVPPPFLAGADDNRVWRDHRFESLCVVDKPSPPNRFARLH